MTMNNFGRVIEVMAGGRLFSNAEYAIEGSVPFDNDPLPNESEIRLWNLSQDTINRFAINSTVMVNAGYRGDVGLILHGFLSKVQTKREGVEQVTTLFVLDSQDLSSRKIDVAYTEGTTASYILREMAGQLGLPIGQFELNQDYRYEDGYTAKGEVSEIITKVAKDCGTSAYINKGKLYIRNLRSGADNVFQLNPNTGMIGSPEPYQNEQFKGFNLKSQLQYRITTASVIDLESRTFQGRVHVLKGSHKFSNTGDFVTEAEVIEP
ncbi:hypothetical protein ABH899_005755 [Paenibacillus sp. RC84]